MKTQTNKKKNENVVFRGRPPIPIPVPTNKVFTVSSLFSVVQRRKNESLRPTRVTVGNFVNALLVAKKIKLVERKMAGSRGASTRYFKLLRAA